MKKIVSLFCSIVMLVVLITAFSINSIAAENKKSTAYEITTTKPASATFVYIDDWDNDIYECDDEMWFKFKAPTSDYYEFEVIDGDEDFDFNIYDSTGKSVGWGDYDSFSEDVTGIINLKAGETYYLKLNYYGEDTVTIQMSAKKHTHTYKIEDSEKATMDDSGYVIKECSKCGKTTKKTYYYAKTVKLSSTSYVYDGKTKTPKIIVSDSKGNNLVMNTDYKVSGTKSAKAIGKYSIKISFIGNYSGSKTLSYSIKPDAPKNVKRSKVTSSSITLTWDKVSKATSYTVYMYEYGSYSKVKTVTTNTAKISNLSACSDYKFKVYAVTKTDSSSVSSSASSVITAVTAPEAPSGYIDSTSKGKVKIDLINYSSNKTSFQIYMATSKNGDYKLVKTIKNVEGFNDPSATIKDLKSGKTYYFKVRSYYTKNSVTAYSGWSKTAAVKVL